MAQIIKEGDRWLISGVMTITHMNVLLDEAAALPPAKSLEIDLTAVSDVDTATISLLFEWVRQAYARKCKVTFANLPENLSALASLYGVLALIPQTAQPSH